MIAGAMHLAETLNEVPAIIFVCGPVVYPPNAPMEQFVWSALYPAAQNLIVAARSLDLGTTFTTFHMFVENELRELLGIPKEIKFGVMIPDRLAAERFRQGQAQANLQGDSLG
jgi:nitroreductase